MNSFLQGKKILKTEALTRPAQNPITAPRVVAGKPAKPAAHAHAHAPAGKGAATGSSTAHVEVVKEGDKVVRLIVTCVCGERVEVECLYPAGG